MQKHSNQTECMATLTLANTAKGLKHTNDKKGIDASGKLTVMWRPEPCPGLTVGGMSGPAMTGSLLEQLLAHPTHLVQSPECTS